MGFFARISAALVWAISVCGLAAYALSVISPDRPDVSLGDMAATVAVLAASTVLVVAGFCAAGRQ